MKNPRIENSRFIADSISRSNQCTDSVALWSPFVPMSRPTDGCGTYHRCLLIVCRPSEFTFGSTWRSWALREFDNQLCQHLASRELASRPSSAPCSPLIIDPRVYGTPFPSPLIGRLARMAAADCCDVIALLPSFRPPPNVDLPRVDRRQTVAVSRDRCLRPLSAVFSSLFYSESTSQCIAT